MADAAKTVLSENRADGFAVGVAAMIAAVATVAAWLWNPDIGKALMAAWAGLALVAASWRRPVAMYWALWAAALFNYGIAIKGINVKPTEIVQIAMIGLAMMRLVAGDREALARLARAGWLVGALALLAAIAVVSSARHPNFFNVRYEILNYATILYGVLFFRARDWPGIALLFAVAVGVEACAALGLRFGFGITGLEFLGEQGGVFARTMTDADLKELAGGRFRLAGTMSHKNMLAAFIVLMLPLIGVEIMHRKKFAWAIAVVPALAALALTDSMAGWLGIVIAAALLIVFVRRFDYFAIMMLMIMPVMAIAVWKFGEPMFYRVQQLFALTHSGWGSVSARFEIIGISRQLIEEHPWLGIGRNNFLTYGNTYFTHAHNLFLMKIIEMGIPGGLAFIGVIIAIFGKIWLAIARDSKRLAAEGQYYYVLGATLGLTGVLAMNMLDYNWVHFSVGPMFAGMIGILLTATSSSNQEIRD